MNIECNRIYIYTYVCVHNHLHTGICEDLLIFGLEQHGRIDVENVLNRNCLDWRKGALPNFT